MDRFFILDYWEGILLANAVGKKLDEHLDEEFHQQVSMEVTKRVSNIMNIRATEETGIHQCR
jgi:hypothetical protein